MHGLNKINKKIMKLASTKLFNTLLLGNKILHFVPIVSNTEWGYCFIALSLQY